MRQTHTQIHGHKYKKTLMTLFNSISQVENDCFHEINKWFYGQQIFRAKQQESRETIFFLFLLFYETRKRICEPIRAPPQLHKQQQRITIFSPAFLRLLKSTYPVAMIVNGK